MQGVGGASTTIFIPVKVCLLYDILHVVTDHERVLSLDVAALLECKIEFAS